MTTTKSHQRVVNGKVVLVKEYENGHQAHWHPQANDVAWGNMLHNAQPGHDKVYSVSVVEGPDGKCHVLATWGKNGGSHAQGHKGAYADPSEAMKAAQALIKTKQGKGYHEASMATWEKNAKPYQPIAFQDAGIGIEHSGWSPKPQKENRVDPEAAAVAKHTAEAGKPKATPEEIKAAQEELTSKSAAAKAVTDAEHASQAAVDAIGSTHEAQLKAHEAAAAAWKGAHEAHLKAMEKGPVPASVGTKIKQQIAHHEGFAEAIKGKLQAQVAPPAQPAPAAPVSKDGHWTVKDGKTTWAAGAPGEGHVAPSLHARTAVGMNKNQGYYLRATNMADAKAILGVLHGMGGKEVLVKQSGGNHFGKQSAFPHIYLGHGAEAGLMAAQVHAALEGAPADQLPAIQQAAAGPAPVTPAPHAAWQGSDKQIEWAKGIKSPKHIDAAVDAFKAKYCDTPEKAALAEQARAWLHANNDAKFWIDNKALLSGHSANYLNKNAGQAKALVMLAAQSVSAAAPAGQPAPSTAPAPEAPAPPAKPAFHDMDFDAEMKPLQHGGHLLDVHMGAASGMVHLQAQPKEKIAAYATQAKKLAVIAAHKAKAGHAPNASGTAWATIAANWAAAAHKAMHALQAKG